jgi:transcription antitermination factor NusG
MCWFAAYTKSRSEFKALDHFTKSGVNAYVPEYTDIRQWSDRIKKARTPAISRYVFFELPKINYDLINLNPFTKNVVKAFGRPINIKDQEILSLKEALKNYTVDNCFQFGDSVKIENGPFKNKIGKVDGVSESHIFLLINTIKVRLSLSSSKVRLAG